MNVKIILSNVSGETVLEIDGKTPDRVREFHLHCNNPDEPAQLVVIYDPDVVTVEGPATVLKVPVRP